MPDDGTDSPTDRAASTGPAGSGAAGSGAGEAPPAAPPKAAGRQARKQVLLRLDPQVHDALARWAGEELRSANAQIEFLLRRALAEAGRLPGGAGPIAPRGRPRTTPDS
ncbi:AT hook motif protein [Streptomyces sp. NPDC006487]|uniref:AT hook motif protein n=1 Tax=Streptomyces sp. NPDC006487 TaxID=3364748 RepID=UPI0036BCAEE2